MKKLFPLILLLIVAMLLPACGSQKSTEVNLYAWSEYVPQDLLDGFTEETGIKVNYDTYSSNEELMAKLQAGASGFDVIIPSDYTVDILIKQGLLEEIDLTKIPNFVNIYDNLKNPDFDPGNKYSVPYQWGTTGLAINRDVVTAPITKWADLWDPAYEGRLVMLDDEREVIGMVLTVLGYDKNTTNEAELEEAKVKLQELMPNIRVFDSDSPKTALLAGDVWMGLVWNGEGSIAHSENASIDYICPEEGCGIWFDNLAIPKGAPHMDAALALINYILKPEASLLITMEFPYSNPNKAAIDLMKSENPELYDSYMNFTATNPSQADIDNANPVVDVGDATAIYDRIWTEVKGGE